MIVIYSFVYDDGVMSLFVDHDAKQWSNEPSVVAGYANGAIQATVTEDDFNNIQDYCIKHKYEQIR
jgi:hypothetical protein